MLYIYIYEKVNSIYLYEKVNSIYLYEKVGTRSKLNWDFPKYAISRICFKLCGIFLFFRKILMLSQNMCKNKKSLPKN